MQRDVCLASFDGSDFNKGAGFLKITLWCFVNALIVGRGIHLCESRWLCCEYLMNN